MFIKSRSLFMEERTLVNSPAVMITGLGYSVLYAEMKDLESLIAQMTLEEKVSLCPYEFGLLIHILIKVA